MKIIKEYRGALNPWYSKTLWKENGEWVVGDTLHYRSNNPHTRKFYASSLEEATEVYDKYRPHPSPVWWRFGMPGGLEEKREVVRELLQELLGDETISSATVCDWVFTATQTQMVNPIADCVRQIV